eukprot:1826445-Pyramimonas_sp.AAC.1
MVATRKEAAGRPKRARAVDYTNPRGSRLQSSSTHKEAQSKKAKVAHADAGTNVKGTSKQQLEKKLASKQEAPDGEGREKSACTPELKGRPKRSTRADVHYSNPRESQVSLTTPKSLERSLSTTNPAQAGAGERRKAATTSGSAKQKATKTSERDEADPERENPVGAPLTPKTPKTAASPEVLQIRKAAYGKLRRLSLDELHQ